MLEGPGLIGERIYLSDTTPDSSVTPQDLVRVFALDGTELPPLVGDAVTPNQVTATYDDALALADFARERVRIIDLATGAERRSYLVGNGDGTGEDRIRGVYPLRNGDYLVSGRSTLDRSVLDRIDGTLRPVPDGSSSSGQLIGTACLPGTP